MVSIVLDTKSSRIHAFHSSILVHFRKTRSSKSELLFQPDAHDLGRPWGHLAANRPCAVVQRSGFRRIRDKAIGRDAESSQLDASADRSFLVGKVKQIDDESIFLG